MSSNFDAQDKHLFVLSEEELIELVVAEKYREVCAPPYIPHFLVQEAKKLIHDGCYTSLKDYTKERSKVTEKDFLSELAFEIEQGILNKIDAQG